MPPPAEIETHAESEPEPEEMEEDVVESEDDGVETEDDGGSEEDENGKGSEEGDSRGGARVSVAAAAGDGGVGSERPPNSCCVCMEPWTCNNAHRICCIPCGHVYGRSCLERWLQRCGNMSAKCPQCGERFELKHITNLYAPGDLWGGCCCTKEFSTQIAQLRAEVAEDVNKLRAEVAEDVNKLRAEVESRLNDLLKHLGHEQQQLLQQQQQQAIALQQQQCQTATMFTWLQSCIGTLYEHFGLSLPAAPEIRPPSTTSTPLPASVGAAHSVLHLPDVSSDRTRSVPTASQSSTILS